MTSMRHLPRGHLRDPGKPQKKLLPGFNQVGVLGNKPISRKSLKLVFKLLHFLIYLGVYHKRDCSSFPS
jgi:hypothetical protein